MVHLIEYSPPAKKSKNPEVSASDIRQRYRAEVGFRSQNPQNTSASAKLPNNRQNEILELSKDDENKLFRVSLNSLALKGIINHLSTH